MPIQPALMYWLQNRTDESRRFDIHQKTELDVDTANHKRTYRTSPDHALTCPTIPSQGLRTSLVPTMSPTVPLKSPRKGFEMKKAVSMFLLFLMLCSSCSHSGTGEEDAPVDMNEVMEISAWLLDKELEGKGCCGFITEAEKTYPRKEDGSL